MDNKPIVFEFQGQSVRVVIINGEPWWTVRDVCQILAIRNVSDAVNRLNQKGVALNDTLTPGGNQKLTIINEPNLYRLIFRSDKKEAKEFQDWVFEEVLPSIRKTGGYSVIQGNDPWANARRDEIEARNKATDSWKARGIKEGIEYAKLTNTEYKKSFDMTAREYRKYKGLPPNANVREHMTDMELLFTAINERAATEIHEQRDSYGFDELHRDVSEAGEATKRARLEIEKATKRQVISPSNRLGQPKQIESQKRKRESQNG